MSGWPGCKPAANCDGPADGQQPIISIGGAAMAAPESASTMDSESRTDREPRGFVMTEAGQPGGIQALVPVDGHLGEVAADPVVGLELGGRARR
jgi:hypothetical protein